MAILGGYDQFEAALTRLDRTVQGKILIDALKDAAEPMRDRAAQLAPVLTGNLQAHEIISVARGTSTSSYATVRVGPSMDAYYGIFDELGTAHQTAQPFLEPAFDDTSEQAERIIAESLASAIEAAVK